MAHERPRILVLEGSESLLGSLIAGSHPAYETVSVPNLREALARLQSESFVGILAATSDPKVWHRIRSLQQIDSILEVLREGIAVVSPDLRILWANVTFEKWCSESVKDRNFYEALGSPEILGPEFSPFYRSPPVRTVTTRLHRADNLFLELRVTPVIDPSSERIVQYIALCRDVTAEVQQQQKLDALHQAGRELASLTTEQLGDMCVDERVELLKYNIRRLTHDLLQYDVIEIRLLEPASGRLEPLLAEGMTQEAAARVLYAREEDNGVTGYVAATGRSYICSDAASDPHYIQGSEGARSSLTVALISQDKTLGTFNVESPQLNAFGPQDLQFAEIFCRELASALNTLDLLLVEKRTTASQSIEAVSREVALPVDEILNSATYILDQWIGHEPEMIDKLRSILNSARSIKQSIMKVGEDLTPQARPFSAPVHETPSRVKSMRVLVVDNDERVRLNAHSVLGRLGCIVETARDGREALRMAKLGTYDAMLADIHLPDVNGYEVFRLLRQAQPKARVILMTGYGYDSGHSIVKARQEGLRHVLFKPFRVEQLLSALHSQEPAPADTLRKEPEPVKA